MILALPYPPSVNSLFDGGHKSPRRFKSKEYCAWIEQAGWVLKAQAHKIKPITGALQVTYRIGKPDNRRRDLANLEKALSDLLVKHKVIADDSDIARLVMEWAKIDGVEAEIVGIA